MSISPTSVDDILAQIVQLPRAARLAIQSGIEPLCVPAPRIEIHHPGTDQMYEWDTALHGPKSQLSFDPERTPSVHDYLETFEYVQQHPTEANAIQLREDLLPGLRQGVITSSRVFNKTDGASILSHNYSSIREQNVIGTIHGLSGILRLPVKGFDRLLQVYANWRELELLSDSEMIAPFITGGRRLRALDETVRQVFGVDIAIRRDAPWVVHANIPRNYGIEIRLTEKEFIFNLRKFI